MRRRLLCTLALLGNLVSTSALAAQIESLSIARPEGERQRCS